MANVRKGQKVIGQKGEFGTTTGGKRPCAPGCTGMQIAVRWEDGSLAYCCTNNMAFTNDVWTLAKKGKTP
jgi:hypothetical protein